MKVIIIEEVNLGTLGVAKDIPSAIDFLVKTDWLHGYDAFLVDDGYGGYVWKDLDSIFGTNWASILQTYSINELNKILGEGDGFFSFKEAEVYNQWLKNLKEARL